MSSSRPKELRVIHKITLGTADHDGLLRESFSFELGDKLALFNVQTSTTEYVRPNLGMAKAMGSALPLLSRYRELVLSNNRLQTPKSRMEVMRAYVIVMAAMNGEEIPKETPHDTPKPTQDYSRR